MTQTNIIKQKSFHVQEDFFNEIINGFQEEKSKEDDGLVIMPPKQKMYLQRVVSPILLKEFERSKVLVNYFSNQVQRTKDLQMSLIQQKFMIAMRTFMLSEAEINEAEDAEETKKSGGFDLFSLMRIYRTYKTISRFYVAFKQYQENDDVKNFSLSNYDFTNPSDYHTFQTDFQKYINGKIEAIVPVFTELMYPVAKTVIHMYDDALHKIFRNVGLYVIRAFTIGNNAFDYALNAISLVATAFALTGVGAGVAAGAKAIQVSMAATRLFKMFSKFGKSINSMAKFKKVITATGKTVKVFGRSAALVTPKLHSTKKFGIIPWKSLKRTWTERIITTGIMFEDLIDVTDEDVVEYREIFKSYSSKWGAKVELKYTDDLARQVTTGMDFVDYMGKQIYDSTQQFKGVPDIKKQAVTNYEIFGQQIEIIGIVESDLIRVFDRFRGAINSVLVLEEYDKKSKVYRIKSSIVEQVNAIFSETKEDIKKNVVGNDGKQIDADTLMREIVSKSNDLLNRYKVTSANDDETKDKKIAEGVKKQNINRTQSSQKVKNGSFRYKYECGTLRGFGLYVEDKNNTGINLRQKYKSVHWLKNWKTYDLKGTFSLLFYKDGFMKFEMLNGNSRSANDKKMILNDYIGNNIDDLFEWKSQELELETMIDKTVRILCEAFDIRIKGEYKKELNALIKHTRKRLKANSVLIDEDGWFGSSKYEVENYDEAKWENYFKTTTLEKLIRLNQEIDDINFEHRLSGDVDEHAEKLDELTERYIGKKNKD